MAAALSGREPNGWIFWVVVAVTTTGSRMEYLSLNSSLLVVSLLVVVVVAIALLACLMNNKNFLQHKVNEDKTNS